MAKNNVTVSRGPRKGKKDSIVTVGELIAALQKLDPNHGIVPFYEGTDGEFSLSDIEEIPPAYYEESMYRINVEHY